MPNWRKTIVFEVDGRNYKVRVKKLKRSGIVTDGKNAGRLDVSLEMDREILGTFYNYTLDIDADLLSLEEYDELYETLTDPDMPSHLVKMPYGQGYLTFRAYITQVDDELAMMGEDFRLWKNASIQFTAMKPQREAS